MKVIKMLENKPRLLAGRWGLTIMAVLLLAACKPTEKNYYNAYEKAYAASQRKAEAENTSYSGGKLESIDGPRIEIMDGDTIYVSRDAVKPIENSANGETGKVGIAVAKYTMHTNARRHAEALKEEYPGAFVATDGNDNYYVMIKRVPGISDALDPIRVFRTLHPDYRYIGLGNSPHVFIFF